MYGKTSGLKYHQTPTCSTIKHPPKVSSNTHLTYFSVTLAAAWQNQQNDLTQRKLRSTWRSIVSFAVLRAQSEDWSDWAYAQADLSLCWRISHFVCFVMWRVRYYFTQGCKPWKKNLIMEFSHSVNLLIFVAINFRALSMEHQFAAINFRVSLSCPISYNGNIKFSRKYMPC